MAVGTPYYTQAAYRPSGYGNVNWPASAAAGMLAVLSVTGGSETTPKKQPTDTTGWTLKKSDTYVKTWEKKITAADLVGGVLAVDGYLPFLRVYPGARGIGKTTDDVQGVTITEAGGGLDVFGRGASALTPATGKLGTDVQNAKYNNRYTNAWFRAATVTGYLKLDGTWNGTDSHGYELLPSSGPDAPTLVSPASGLTLDPTVVNYFQVTHRSNANLPQTAIKIKVVNTTVPSTKYLLADGTLSATDTAISSSLDTQSIDAAQLTSGHAYTWTAATSEDGSTFSAYAPASPFNAASRPTVVATLTTVAENLVPTASWVPTVTGVQVASRTKITPSAATDSSSPMWDSGVVAGAGTSLPVEGIEADWVNGAAYKSWTSVQDSTSLWSLEDDSVAATVSWTAPTAPTSVTATNAAGQPLTVTVAGIPAGMELLEIEYSTDNTTYYPLTSLVPDATSEAVSVPLAPYGVPWWYRARVVNVVSGVSLRGAWRVSAAAVASTDLGGWLVSDDGTFWTPVRIRSRSTRGAVQASSVWYGLGATVARVDSGAIHGEAGGLVFLTRTYAERVALHGFLSAVGIGNPFRIRWNPEVYGGSYTDLPPTRIARTSPLSEDDLAEAAIQARLTPMNWVSQ